MALRRSDGVSGGGSHAQRAQQVAGHVQVFCSRHAWKWQVAYPSQFETATDRAHRGQAKIKSRLVGAANADEWDLPPKPKWMRWRTYHRAAEKFDRYEAILDAGFALVARLTGRET